MRHLMLWLVSSLKVEVNESSLHFIEILDAELQRLADIMRLMKRHVSGQHHIDLYNKAFS